MLYCYYGICSFSVVSIFAESYYVYLISRTFVGEGLVSGILYASSAIPEVYSSKVIWTKHISLKVEVKF